MIKFFLTVIFAFFSLTTNLLAEEIFIRMSQIGYLPSDIKNCVILSSTKIGTLFRIIAADSKQKVFESELQLSAEKYNNFFVYYADFSSLKTEGAYLLSVGSTASKKFKINKYVFNDVRDSLALFFKVQRCGPTHPMLHQVCHLYDVERLIGDDDVGTADLTGGWHDAGDYLKFLSTTAYTTYMLMFSYEFDPVKFGYDNDKNGVADILEEAKVGLDWLLRCNYAGDKLVTQVQDLEDHKVGWRKPENDTLRYQRPGYVSSGKNIVGIYAAVMAAGYRIWLNKFKDDEFAEKCLYAAEKIYSTKDNVRDIDTSFSDAYKDDNFIGKLALGAIEIYISTKEKKYLKDAFEYAEKAGSDYWWSWGNFNSLAHYKLAKINPEYADYIFENLKFYNKNCSKNIFGESMEYSWGTTNSFLGAALQAILFEDLKGKRSEDSLKIFQRDFILGRNPWGISFIYNIGWNYPKFIHSQVAYFNGGYIPGALVGGPAPFELLQGKKLTDKNSKFEKFNNNSAAYFDDRSNFITNEAAISVNATALFVFGYYTSE